MVYLPEKFSAKKAVTEPVVQSFCATLWPRLICLDEKFRAVRNRSVYDDFRLGSIDAQYLAGNAVDGIIFHLSGGAVSEEVVAHTKEENVINAEVTLRSSNHQ